MPRKAAVPKDGVFDERDVRLRRCPYGVEKDRVHGEGGRAR